MMISIEQYQKFLQNPPDLDKVLRDMLRDNIWSPDFPLSQRLLIVLRSALEQRDLWIRSNASFMTSEASELIDEENTKLLRLLAGDA
jgi:hypothetical protein